MLRVGRQGERVDSLTTVLDLDYTGGPDGTVAMPLGRQTAFAARDSSIFVATGDDYQVDVYDLSGSLVRIQRRDGQRRVASETNKSAWFAALLAEALDDREAAWVRERYRSVPFPERLPAYSQRMLHDDAGNLWVEQFAAPDDTVRVWDVFDNRGQYVVEVKVPSPFAISQVVSDQVLGIWIDTLDIQTVRAYKLQRVGQ
jgi:hypothetical protein